MLLVRIQLYIYIYIYMKTGYIIIRYSNSVAYHSQFISYHLIILFQQLLFDTHTQSWPMLLLFTRLLYLGSIAYHYSYLIQLSWIITFFNHLKYVYKINFQHVRYLGSIVCHYSFTSFQHGVFSCLYTSRPMLLLWIPRYVCLWTKFLFMLRYFIQSISCITIIWTLSAGFCRRCHVPYM